VKVTLVSPAEWHMAFVPFPATTRSHRMARCPFDSSNLANFDRQNVRYTRSTGLRRRAIFKGQCSGVHTQCSMSQVISHQEVSYEVSRTFEVHHWLTENLIRNSIVDQHVDQGSQTGEIEWTARENKVARMRLRWHARPYRRECDDLPSCPLLVDVRMGSDGSVPALRDRLARCEASQQLGAWHTANLLEPKRTETSLDQVVLKVSSIVPATLSDRNDRVQAGPISFRITGKSRYNSLIPNPKEYLGM
jgi:hypothetical protein